MNSKVWSY